MSTKPKDALARMSAKLQELQRQRAWFIKTRNMVNNRLQATVAGEMGYSSGLDESERKKMFAAAGTAIKQIVAGECEIEGLDGVEMIVLATHGAISVYEKKKKDIEKDMLATAKELPVAEWVQHEDQRGFGLLFLAIVIGETGDLRNYANPGKVWRRLGCAPFTKDDETLCGATWRSRSGNKQGLTKLGKADWAEFGYSPRRRSIAFLIGEGIVKQNSDGPYRQRYLDVKTASAETHPDWLICPKCSGSKETEGGKKCQNCNGTGEVWMHAHRHAMLLATKLLLKNLWKQWNPSLVREMTYEQGEAGVETDRSSVLH